MPNPVIKYRQIKLLQIKHHNLMFTIFQKLFKNLSRLI